MSMNVRSGEFVGVIVAGSYAISCLVLLTKFQPIDHEPMLLVGSSVLPAAAAGSILVAHVTRKQGKHGGSDARRYGVFVLLGAVLGMLVEGPVMAFNALVGPQEVVGVRGVVVEKATVQGRNMTRKTDVLIVRTEAGHRKEMDVDRDRWDGIAVGDMVGDYHYRGSLGLEYDLGW